MSNMQYLFQHGVYINDLSPVEAQQTMLCAVECIRFHLERLDRHHCTTASLLHRDSCWAHWYVRRSILSDLFRLNPEYIRRKSWVPSLIQHCQIREQLIGKQPPLEMIFSSQCDEPFPFFLFKVFMIHVFWAVKKRHRKSNRWMVSEMWLNSCFNCFYLEFKSMTCFLIRQIYWIFHPVLSF